MSGFVLPLRPDCTRATTRSDLAALAAAMLWPDDTQARAAWIEGAIIREITDNQAEIDEATVRWALALASNRDPISSLQAAGAERWTHGLAIGWVVHEAIGAATFGGGKANLIKLAEKFSSIVRKSTNKQPRISPNHIVKVLWRRLRPVAHLWAAYYAASSGMLRDFPCTRERLGTFLAEAESYRQLGEQTHTKHGSLFRKGESAQLPAALVLPAIGPVEFVPKHTYFSSYLTKE